MKKEYLLMLTILLVALISHELRSDSTPVHAQTLNPVSIKSEEQRPAVTVRVVHSETKEIKANPKNEKLDNLEKVSKCLDTLMKKIANECDEQCFIKKMPSNSRLRKFIDAGWFSDTEKFEIKEEKTLMLNRFYYALSKANLLTGMVKHKEDKVMAIKLLNELIVDEPGNAIFYAFKAVIEDQVGQNKKALETIAQMNAHGNYFKNYFLEWNQEMRNSSVNNPNAYFNSLRFTSRIPIPNYNAILVFQKQQGLDLEDLGWLMVAKGVEKDGHLMNLEWDTFEYSVGYKLINPDKENLRSNIPHPVIFYMRDDPNYDIFTYFENKSCQEKYIYEWLNFYKKEIR